MLKRISIYKETISSSSYFQTIKIYSRLGNCGKAIHNPNKSDPRIQVKLKLNKHIFASKLVIPNVINSTHDIFL